MAVTPNHGNSVITFPLHIGWVHIFGHLVHLEDLPAVDLIDAAGAATLNSELVGVNSLALCFGLRACGLVRACR